MANYRAWTRGTKETEKECVPSCEKRGEGSSAKARWDAGNEFHNNLDTSDAGAAVYRIAKQRMSARKDVGEISVIKNQQEKTLKTDGVNTSAPYWMLRTKGIFWLKSAAVEGPITKVAWGRREEGSWEDEDGESCRVFRGECWPYQGPERIGERNDYRAVGGYMVEESIPSEWDRGITLL